MTISVTEVGSTTPVPDPAGYLLRAQGLTFETFFPFGKYGSCEFFIPGDVTTTLPFKGGQRLVFRNGLKIVWEGGISDIAYVVGEGVTQGWTVKGVGYWARILGVRGINKPWADNRLDETAWTYSTAASGAEKCTLDRLNRLRFTPKAVAWTTNQIAAVRYTAPPGHMVKRVTYDYDLQEGAQNWSLSLVNVTAVALEAAGTITTSGTGSLDITLSAPSQSIDFRFNAGANQTPASDGTIYGEFSNIMVYTETGSINAQEIAKDVRAAVVGLNSDDTRIGALTETLAPFVTNGYEMYADLLARAVDFGDASFNSWNIYLDHSETAPTPDGKPVLVLEQYPALTDYDYAVRLDEASVEIVEDTEGLRNYIVVRYRDELNNRDVYVTPADDANLKDDTAITAVGGQREYVLDAGLTTQAAAIKAGRRALAAMKDPRFYVSQPFAVVGSIRARNGNRVPASEIQAGKRVRIEDFLSDRVGVSGAGLTFIISQTRYDDATETCTITCGVPDDLAVMVAGLIASKGQSAMVPGGGRA